MENLVDSPKGKLIDDKFYFPARVYYEKPVKPSAQDGKTIF